MKTVLHDSDGSITKYAPPRECLDLVLATLRAQTTRRIDARCPRHDRENAALGLIDATPIAAVVAEERLWFRLRRIAAENAFFGWDGSPETADAAAAAILAVLELP